MRALTPTVFESFNARALKPSQVAQTFVPSQQYDRLAKRNHTIIVGPRGSGKTTLLKMLQQPALESWDHPRAEHYRTCIDYTGVFIATDLSWGAQIESLGDGQLDENSHRLLSIAAFTTHVLRSLITAILHRVTQSTQGRFPFRRVTLSEKDEATFVRHVSQAWRIQPTIPSLWALKQALRIRMLQIREIASVEVSRGSEGRGTRLADLLFLHSHFVDAASVAVGAFNEMVGAEGDKWTLMFDELELAPEWIQDELIRSLRSTDPNFLYKLAMTPHSHSARLLQAENDAVPSADQDFDQIALWYVEKVESLQFCNDLWYSMLEDRGIPLKEPRRVLGPSFFETDQFASGPKAVYVPNSKASQRFVSLAQNDATFNRYLGAKGIDPREFNRLPGSTMDSIIRKMAPLVAIREYYRAADKERTRDIVYRTRKSAVPYTGSEPLFTVTEGNPRLFIGIVGRLLDNWQNYASKIKRGAQSKELRKTAQRFSAMLRTIPAPPSQILGTRRGIFDLIAIIGSFFFKEVVIEDFIAEPPLTFRVDQNISDEILLMLQQALNVGAIVYVPDDDTEIILASVRGKRFRVSYILAPLFRLPLRLGVEASLLRILRSSAELDMTSTELDTTIDLPFEEGVEDE
jgi:hypothetical protein